MRAFFKIIIEDVKFYNGGHFRLFSIIWNSSLKIVLYYRFAHYFRCNSKYFFVFAKLFEWLIKVRYASDINGFAIIGKNIMLPHPYGIVIGGKTRIGDNCFIGQHVTLGGNMGKSRAEGVTQPVIGDNTMLCAGCVVVGPIEIGNNNIIAANAVVTKSFKDDYVVIGGIPAKLLKQLNKEVNVVNE